MILRRLAEALRTQNWFTVVLEIAIVVIGIFIGLQVDAWNQARLDKVDEQVFLERIHEELIDSINVRKFIRDAKFEDWPNMVSAMETLLRRDDRDKLSPEECGAINRSSYKTTNVAELPSLLALISTGRMGIIRDKELNASLMRFEQQRQVLQRLAELPAISLASSHPHLVKLASEVRPNGNIESDAVCDLAGMRADQGFMNDFAENIDKFEAYMSSGLIPLVSQIDPLHTLLDQSLQISHDEQAKSQTRE